jgi:hypothetical protein
MNPVYAQLGQFRSEFFGPIEQNNAALIESVAELTNIIPAYLKRDFKDLRKRMKLLAESGQPIKSDAVIQKRVCGIYSKFITCDHTPINIKRPPGELSKKVAFRYVNKVETHDPETFKKLAALLWDINQGLHGEHIQELLNDSDPILMIPEYILPLLLVHGSNDANKTDLMLRIVRNESEVDAQLVSHLREKTEIQLEHAQLGQMLADLRPILQNDAEVLAENFINWSDYASAIEVIPLIDDDETRSKLLDEVVEGMAEPIFDLLKDSRWDEARQLAAKLPISEAHSKLEAMIEELDYYKRLEPEKASNFLTTLPKELYEARKALSKELDDRARQLRIEKKIDEAIELALIEPSVTVRDAQLANIVEVLINSKEYERAEELLSAIQTDEYLQEMQDMLERYLPN